MKTSRTTRPRFRGYLMLMGLVFGAIFLTVLGALSSVSFTQNKVQNAATGGVKALAIAEAGLEYYRWYLAHNPGDLTNGTGGPGPYVLTYDDPEGGPIGTISLDISGNHACGQPSAIDIVSTGAPNDGSNITRTIRARYAQPTVAQFSYVLNSSVWAGSDRIINGPYHSNGGIRMDGTVNAPVSSSLESWLCTSSFGCSPQQEVDGVFGSGPNSNLWTFPVPQIDFNGIAADFGSLKTVAQSSGYYLPRFSTGASNSAAYGRGYHLIFNENGTVTVRRVSATTQLNVIPVNNADGNTDRSLINNETNYDTYTISPTCGLIFVEDNVWVEGVVQGKVTIVAANVTEINVAPSAVLTDNITYADDESGLTLIAEHNVLVAPDSPVDMNLSGVFIAQNGSFGRNLYRNCNASYEPKGTLTIHGTTVSNKRTGTRWMNGCGNGDNGGYQLRIDAYDRSLSNDPPPFTPVISEDYKFVDWREE